MPAGFTGIHEFERRANGRKSIAARLLSAHLGD
jgi:hypothetical protein